MTGLNQGLVSIQHIPGLTKSANRTNTTSSLSLQLAENCSTGFARKESSQRRTPLKLFDKSWMLSTTYITTTWCIEVQMFWLRRSECTDYLIDLKPENLLYLTPDSNSALVLADFGIAKMLDSKNEVLTTMAGSFGYAAPEVMLKKGHGKPVDMWSMGVITYTLLCGYSPFRSENLSDLIEECKNGRVIFHERYWKDVSKDAKEFILALLQPDPNKRPSSEVIRLSQ